MNYSKESDSYCAETEPFKESMLNTLSMASPRVLKFNSDETSPYKSFYSAYTPVIDYSRRYLLSDHVFDRLIADSNRRYDNKERLNLLIEQKEKEEIRNYTEKEEVYARLLNDTEIRRQQKEAKEKIREQELENTLRSFKNEKTCTKEQADQIVNRLLSKNHADSPKRIVELEYKFNKQKDLTRFLSFDDLKSREKEDRLRKNNLGNMTTRNSQNEKGIKDGLRTEVKSFKGNSKGGNVLTSRKSEGAKGGDARIKKIGNCEAKDNCEAGLKTERVRDCMDIVERTEIEQRYGKPGKPADPEAERRFIGKKMEKKKSVGFYSAKSIRS